VISRERLLEIIRIQNEIGRIGGDLGDVMTFVVEQTLSLVNADGAVIELAEGGDMVYRSTAGTARDTLGLRVAQQGSLSGLCVEAGVALCCDDSESDLRVDRDACRGIGFRSMIVIPLKNDTLTIGVLKVVASEPSRFSDMDVAVLELVSGFLTTSIFFATEYNSDKLFYLASHDRLTGIANRSHFMDRLRYGIDQSRRTQRAIAVLVFDMDGLQIINEKYGYLVGDAILNEFAACLKSVVRISDTVARIGGDEFALILNPVDAPNGVDTVIKRIQEESVYPFLYEGEMYLLRASIGAAHYPGEAGDIDQLLDLAEQRMYAIKQEKKQNKSIFQPLLDF
jgi:diguanylate cyclase (GGDEF)-like protein